MKARTAFILVLIVVLSFFIFAAIYYPEAFWVSFAVAIITSLALMPR